MLVRLHALVLGIGLGFVLPLQAETLSGLCPDGSAFVVQHRGAVPCSNPRFVEPGDMPPLRPELLPRPYTWQVDQAARNPNNPYNLVERARRIRELGQNAGAQAQTERPENLSQVPGPPTGSRPALAEQRVNAVVRLSLEDPELRNLLELVELRQQLAPARIEARDETGAPLFQISFAYSSALEARARSTLRLADARHVLAFVVYAREAGKFNPNFFVVQREISFLPEPQDPTEVGLLIGDSGTVSAGGVLLGYLVLPNRFELGDEVQIFWNDQSTATLLRP